MGFLRQESLQEIEEQTERLEAENKRADMQVSLAQKRQMAAELRERGLSAKHFGFNWASIKNFLKNQ